MLPAVAFFRTTVANIRLRPRRARTVEKSLQVVHGEIQIEVVHVADIDVDFSDQLRANRLPTGARVFPRTPGLSLLLATPTLDPCKTPHVSYGHTRRGR